jgi:hypothetical protein
LTAQEFSDSLNRKILDIVKNGKPMLIAVKSVAAMQSKRIFLEGKAKDGTSIGDYGYEELYVNPKNSPKKFTPRGKSGKTKKANGEKYVTGYFANYLEFKKTIGKNKGVNTVDLQLFGELSRDWANARVVANPNPTKVSPTEYIISLQTHNADKARRYGLDRVFGASKEERAMFKKVFEFEIRKALTNK